MSEDAASERILPEGLLGFLDAFQHHEAGREDVLSFHGWVLGGDSRIRSVVLKRKRGGAIPISYGLTRPDVAEEYPQDPRAGMSGFAGVVSIRRTAIRRLLPEQVEICAVLDGGREVRCFSRSFPLPNAGLPASGTAQFGTFVSTVARKAIVAYRDGGLTFSRLSWFRGLRSQYRQMFVERRAARLRSSGLVVADLQHAQASLQGVMLRSFLDSHTRLSWPQQTARVSIILVLFNGAELTLQCLRSLQGLLLPIEIIIVDNASTDETSRLLDRLDGVKILRHREKDLHVYYEAVQAATGDHILFLSGDIETLPGSLESALRTLESAEDIGAVGAKILSRDGRLHEAGGIVWRDGSRRAYGRGEAARMPAYMYQRDVDYCSGAFLLARRELLSAMDEFEDVDFCLRVWKSGRRVVFDPGAVVARLEFAGSAAETGGVKRPVGLVERHAEWIARKHEPGDAHLLAGRTTSRPGRKVLILDDRVPHFRHGAGFPRTCELIRTLDESGHCVTFYPMTIPNEDWTDVYEDIPRTVEVIVGLGAARLQDFLRERDSYYDWIIVSRPHNMKTVQSLFWRDGAWITKARVIYDAEAIGAWREAEQRRLSGIPVTESDVAHLLSEEMSLTKGVHAVFSVTDRERDYFLSSGIGTVWTVGHTVAVNPTPRPFSERTGFLFVGDLKGIPNRDAVLWFSKEIWPKVRSLVNASFSVVGDEPPPEIRALPDLDVLGPVPDLTPLYDRSRIFVAPSRLAAGIPIKVQTAAAHGLPVVCTSILARELSWQDGVELLVADDPDKFAGCCARLYSDADLWRRLRMNALDRVARECSREIFASTLAQALA